MFTYNLEKYIAREDISLVEALEAIDRNGWGILFIVNKENNLIGTLTDGDIRKWILKNGEIKTSISSIIQRKPRYVYIREGLNEDDLEKLMTRERIKAIPLVNDDKTIIDIAFRFSEHNKRKEIIPVLTHTPIIIMAGGKGTRLSPYTKILPKPLIPVGNIPILERIMNRFYDYGANHFFVTVNYKREMIKSYFSDLKPPYTISYICEERPLGTAGSIRLIAEKFDSPVIVSNCDTLIEEDYGKILDLHFESNNDMTLVTSLKNFDIPYGVIRTKDNGIIQSMEEKPRLTYQINTGMYIVNPKYLELIPKDTVFHMTDLAAKMMDLGKQVGVYPISESAFLDMGEFEEMKKMEDRLACSVV